jgi:hypothetical protein
MDAHHAFFAQRGATSSIACVISLMSASMGAFTPTASYLEERNDKAGIAA